MYTKRYCVCFAHICEGIVELSQPYTCGTAKFTVGFPSDECEVYSFFQILYVKVC